MKLYELTLYISRIYEDGDVDNCQRTATVGIFSSIDEAIRVAKLWHIKDWTLDGTGATALKPVQVSNAGNERYLIDWSEIAEYTLDDMVDDWMELL